MVQIALVGKPSAGKSTFFRAATLAEAEIANYPFTTIKPNHGVAFVSIPCADKTFGVQCNPRIGFCKDHYRYIAIDLIDVAGLVPDAHKGEGMGLEFLNDLNQADGLIHVVDISGSVDEKGNPVAPLSYDPLKDIAFLENELDYWYLGILKKGWERYARQIQQEHKEVYKALAKQMSGLRVTEEMAKEILAKLKLPQDPTIWTEEQLLSIAKAMRIASKPMVLAANKIDVPGAQKNLERMQAAYPHLTIIGCSAEAELALKEADKHKVIAYRQGDNTFTILNNEKLSEKQRAALAYLSTFLQQRQTTGVQDILNTLIFKVLGMIAVFPGGVNKLHDSEGRVLPDCFLLPKNSTALDFAFKLHSDFGNNFIKAIDVKTKMPISKDHLLKNGDVIEIMAKK
ncbi:MAG: redox-regulated ATPase YchF [Candidatus Woesearchaeota archaeon]